MHLQLILYIDIFVSKNSVKYCVFHFLGKSSPTATYILITGSGDCGISWMPVNAARACVVPERSSVSCCHREGSRRGGDTSSDTAAKMSTCFSKFSAYTMTQLNEILEDDIKLSNMVQEMDEVRGAERLFTPALATDSVTVFPLLSVPSVLLGERLRK